MTVNSYCRQQIWRKRYGTKPGQQQEGAFHHTYPKDVQLVIVDFMQYVKSLPKNIVTVGDVIRYYVGIIKSMFRHKVECVIVCFDRGSPPVKKVHCHGTRYKKVKRFSEQDSPVLSSNLRKPIERLLDDRPWIDFAGNQKLLQREIYPLLWNALIDPQQMSLRHGHMLVLHGLPSKLQEMTTVTGALWDNRFAHRDTMVKAVPWSLDGQFGDWPITQQLEEADPELYTRVFKVIGVEGGATTFVEEAIEWKNDIVEADNAVFFYQHFPEFRHKHTSICINDGDAVSIALLQSHERITLNNQFINKQFICLPYTEPKEVRSEREKLPGQRNKPPPRYEYVDVNKLHVMLDKDPAFSEMSNPQVTFVMLNILCGSDFFSNYCKGIGPKFIWETFFQSSKHFKHLVQWHACALDPDPTTERRAIVDETLFEQFTYYVYINKYGKSLRKKNKGDLNFSILQTHCSQLSIEKQLPGPREMKLFARHLGWNIQYWLNAARDINVDPFETWDNISYWGYKMDTETGTPKVSYVFRPKQKPMDEAYKRNLSKRKKKRKRSI